MLVESVTENRYDDGGPRPTRVSMRMPRCPPRSGCVFPSAMTNR